MSGASIASTASSVEAVPGGPNTERGLGANDVTQRMVKTSFRSVMWSLCRWVKNRPWRAAAPDVSNIAVTVTTVYSCSFDGSSVAKTSTCTDGYSPMLFVQVSSTGTAYDVLAWTSVASSLNLSSSALMEIPYQ